MFTQFDSEATVEVDGNGGFARVIFSNPLTAMSGLWPAVSFMVAPQLQPALTYLTIVVHVGFVAATVVAFEELRGVEFDHEFMQLSLGADPSAPGKDGMRHLQVPIPTKQFLISPPPSPPLGWEQSVEDPPEVDHSLLAAVGELNSKGLRELLAPAPGLPGICVEDCSTADEVRADRVIPHRSVPPQWITASTRGAGCQYARSALPATIDLIRTRMPPILGAQEK